MDTELGQICASHGWDALYEEAIQHSGISLSQETPMGERRAISPFPFSNDRNPSFSVNVQTGMWRDWHTEKQFGIKGGNFVQFVALMSSRLSKEGKPQPDYKEAERALRIRFGISRLINAEWVAECQDAMKDPHCPGHRLWLGARKRWTIEHLVQMGIGYDEYSKRIMIPIYDRNNDLVNARLYLPGAPDHIPKMRWQQSNMNGNFMFPYGARDEGYIILCEGESDVITMRRLGFNAMCGTESSSNPVPEVESGWFRDKDVYILMDADEPGILAATNAISVLESHTKSLVRVDLPEWPDMPSNADASDWVGYLMDRGLDDAQIVKDIFSHLQACQIHRAIISRYDQRALSLTFNEAMSAQNVQDKVQIKVQMMAKGNDRFFMPILIKGGCPASGHDYCRNCSMKGTWHGDATWKIEPRSAIGLKLIQTETERQELIIRRDAGVSTICPDFKMEVTKYIDVDTALLVSTIDEDADMVEEQSSDKPRREAYILAYDGKPLLPSVEYVLEGFIYPSPKTQKMIFLVDSARRISSRYDTMNVNNDAIDVMRQFETSMPFESMKEVSEDISASSTLIIDRLDLHMVYRCVWYSLISFEFMGQIVFHGWLEALIIGDTRCGKSSTFKGMMALFGTGELVDCKMQTAPGILGAVETSAATGERYVVPGIMPRQDRRGPIGFDEFSASRESRASMMDHLSSTRAEGKVKIVKAASAEFMARVRQIYMSNPARGKLMEDIGGYGVETIPYLINQPEDIARFDLAMVVTQKDVSAEAMNTVRHPTVPRFAMEAHRLLLRWAWSRRPDQVIWAEGAEQAVVGLSQVMYKKYDQSIPLVEPADQRMRIARLAVSIAAQCFSTDSTFENLVVRSEHVFAAGSLYKMIYDKPSMGYDVYSVKVRADRSITNEKVVEGIMDGRFGKNNIIMAEKLLRVGIFTVQMFQNLVPMNNMDVSNTVQILSANRCISPARNTRGSNNYELTPQFVRYLECYIIRKSSLADI